MDSRRWVAGPEDTTGIIVGWAVAAVAIRETDTTYAYRLRPYTVDSSVAETMEAAEAWAKANMVEFFHPDLGWRIDVVAMAIRRTDW